MVHIWKIVTGTLLFILLFYGSLALVPKRPITYMDDDTLRVYALSHGLGPIPKSTEGMLKLTDNPKNPVTAKKVALGQALFFDPILSSDRTVSCASCHKLDEGGDDNLPAAVGVGGAVNPHHLNSPTVLNAALAKRLFWDGRAPDVETQAQGPIQAPFEMHMTPQEAVKRIAANSDYRKRFKEVFDDNVTFTHITEAIGAYERTLLTRSAYDRFLEGDNDAMSVKAKRGLNLFIQKGCKGCHTGISLGGQSLQQFPLRRTLSDLFRTAPFPFPNPGGFLGKEGMKKFRVPILRNITRTAPYFHNGVVKDLREVVRIMSTYQIGETFNEKQIDEVIAFFKSLEGEIVPYRLPQKEAK